MEYRLINTPETTLLTENPIQPHILTRPIPLGSPAFLRLVSAQVSIRGPSEEEKEV